jgi:prepilin-type N-terminal cleavage/methylation domain-containing protein
MRNERTQLKRGFSLVETLVVLALCSLLMGGVMELFRQGINITSAATERSEMQQNTRVALNLMAQDFSIAGTGFVDGGIQLPTGTGSNNPKRGCSSASCGTWDYLTDNRMYAITPGDGLGPTLGGVATDTVTLVYRDPDLATLSAATLASVNSTGTQITTQAGATAGIQANDVLMLCNSLGCAAGVVTSVATGSNQINFADGDSLNFNQSTISVGNIKSISNSGVFPPTTAYRIFVISYFIEASRMRLMRQINAHPPVPVAEVVENLQITYDTFSDDTLAAVADLPTAGDVPNQIRKVNISITVRAPQRQARDGQYDRFGAKTSVSVRNLSFNDRYA